MKTVITIFSYFLGWLCFWGFSFPSLLAQPLSSKCFEIESILVDAWGTPEGENEMVYLRIGPNAINVNDFEIKWPNFGNPWLNFCQNPTTDNKIAAINATINCPTGKLIAPFGGVLPAGAKVLIITSENYDAGSHSFADLCDTLYLVFQCAGNTAGHFANYTASNPENPRTLIIKQKSTNCADTVSYKPSNLTTQSGNGDGDAVFFEPDGTVSYRNIGRKIPTPTLKDQTHFLALRAYPNPTTGYLKVELPKIAPSRYRLYNLQGELVLSGVWEESEAAELNLSDFAQGFYFLELTQGDLRRQIKILKQ